MPIARPGYDRQSEAEHVSTVRDRWLPDDDARGPFARGQADAEELYQLAGASGVAAALSIGAAFWSGVYAILHIWMR